MADRARVASEIEAATDTASSIGSTSEEPSIVEITSSEQGVAGATSRSTGDTEKRMAADQKKDDRALAREIRQKESDNRFTPSELIDAIIDSFGQIDFDPCWHEASLVNPKAYLDVRQGHNGLRDQWIGRLAFVNPPWSNQDKWVKRGYDQWLKGNVDIVVMLVPANTDTKFFQNILSKDADIYFVEGRPRFFKEEGTSDPTAQSTMLVILGATLVQATNLASLVKGLWLTPPALSARRTRGLVRSASSCAPDLSFRIVTCSRPGNAASAASL